MKETIKNNKLSFVLILAAFLFGIIYIRTFTPHLEGDGKEYIMQTVAFQNHFSFGVTTEDIEQAKTEFYNEADDLNEEYYVNQWNHMHEYGDAKYSNHYGSYSALVMPVKLIVMAFGAYPIWAFFITNLILYISAVLVVFFLLKVNVKKKLIMTMLTIFNPALFYLSWTHSEVYLYAFVVIGLVFYYNRQFGRAIFFLSVASMQNLGVLPFAMMVGIDLIVEKIKEYTVNNNKFKLIDFIKQYALSIIPYGLCYIPGMLPLFSTFVKFHTFNLVADAARENKYLFDKAWAYLTDLNLGILPYEPVILLLFLIMIIIGLKRCTREALINLIGVGSMIYIIANQLQINCGMQNIMRYNVWIIPMMIFFVICNWEKIWKTERALLLAGLSETVITTVVISYILIGWGSFSCVQFAHWTNALMQAAPGLYNPTHGIFYSRALGGETYYHAEPIVYTTGDGRARKILLSKEAEEIFYSDSWLLCDENGNEIDKTTLKTVSVDEGDYKYINLTGNIYHIEK